MQWTCPVCGKRLDETVRYTHVKQEHDDRSAFWLSRTRSDRVRLLTAALVLLSTLIVGSVVLLVVANTEQPTRDTTQPTNTTAPATTTAAVVTTTTQPGAASYHDAVMADNPVAYWRFVNTNSETGRHHGTLRGSPAPLLGQPGPFAGSSSIRFDGVVRDNTTTGGFLANSLARLSSTAWSNGFTLEAWAKTTTGEPEQHIMTWSAGSGDAGPGTLFDDPDDRWKFRDGNVSTSMVGSTTINAWHHLVATVDASGNGRLYVDGRRVQTWNSGVDPVAASSGRFTVGADYDSQDCPCPRADTPFNGWIAEAAVYNRPLTQTRIQAHRAATTTTTTTTTTQPTTRTTTGTA